MRSPWHRLLVACLVTFSLAAVVRAEGPMTLFVGTYTGPKSQGIYTMKLDPATGKLTEPVLAGEAKNPSFLTVSANNKFLYAISEVDEFQGKKAGAVSAFSIDPATAKLTLLNQQTTGGTGPCFVSVDPAGKVALVANYGGGSVESIPLAEDGSLKEPATFLQHKGSSVDPSRQKEPHAHSFNFSPDGKLGFAADLGLDKVFIYNIDPATAALTPHDPPFATLPPGSGPRHFAFHPSGKYAYVISEMGMTITAFAFDAQKGSLTPIHTISTLPERDAPSKEFSTAEVQVHPSGKFVYGSNRGHDSISIFTVDESTGQLTWAGNVASGGKTPRNFRIDPTGRFLLAANQQSDNIVVFQIDQTTGLLTPANSEAKVGAPVCIKFLNFK